MSELIKEIKSELDQIDHLKKQLEILKRVEEQQNTILKILILKHPGEILYWTNQELEAAKNEYRSVFFGANEIFLHE